MTVPFYQAMALIESAKTTLAAGRVDILAPFVIISVPYTVFLLLPWALLFLFLLRKRKYLTNEKANLLTSMNLDGEILRRAGLRWILQSVNKMVRAFKAPGYIDRHLLTRLDGLNTWHEARLLE